MNVKDNALNQPKVLKDNDSSHKDSRALVENQEIPADAAKHQIGGVSNDTVMAATSQNEKEKAHLLAAQQRDLSAENRITRCAEVCKAMD